MKLKTIFSNKFTTHKKWIKKTAVVLIALLSPVCLIGNNKITLKYAKRFAVNYKGNATIVTLNSAWKNSKETFTYVLVKRGKKPSISIPKNAVIIETPVKTAALTTTTIIPHFVTLGIQDKVKAVLKIQDVNTKEIINLYKKGKIIEIGTGLGMNQGLSIEKLYKLQPEMIFSYAVGVSNYDIHPKLQEAGFKFTLIGAYMEETPLGRAEWIKFVSLFFGKEKEAEKAFSKTEKKYLNLVSKTKNIVKRPTVLCNISYRGTWYIPQGKSLMATLVNDAGGDFLWKKTKGTASTPTPIEKIIMKARNVDFWLHPGLCHNKNDMLKIAPRIRIIKAFKTNNVFNNNGRLNEYGGNDFYESGLANPDKILADLIAILHPKIQPKHKTQFYKKMK